MDKWLSDRDSEEVKKRKEDMYKHLSKEEVEDLKKKSISEIVKKKEKKLPKEDEVNDFLNELLKFKEWLNQRTFLKGDLDKIEIWIKNLHRKLEDEKIKNLKLTSLVSKTNIKEKFKEIPVDFLDEKTRIAINKQIRGSSKTSSDTYYLKKLKGVIKEKLKEAEYYDILREILEN